MPQDPCQQERDAVTAAQQEIRDNTDPGDVRRLAQNLVYAKSALADCIRAHQPPPPRVPRDLSLVVRPLRIELQYPIGSGTIPASLAATIRTSIEGMARRILGGSPRVFSFDAATPSSNGRLSTWFGLWRGSWPNAPTQEEIDAALQSGQTRVEFPAPSLRSGENVTVGYHIHSLLELSRARWERAPKWYDSDTFRPNPNGDTHLTSFSANFDPHLAKSSYEQGGFLTWVVGTDEQFEPDIDFMIQVEEVFKEENGEIVSFVEATATANSSWLNVFTSLLVNPWGLLGLGFTSGAAIGAYIIAGVIADVTGSLAVVRQIPQSDVNKFAFEGRRLFLTQLATPQGDAVISYSRVGFDSSGYLTGGGVASMRF